MKTETCLEKLLQNMDPKLKDEVYVFCRISDAQLQNLLDHCLCIFREHEGLSAILSRSLAQEEDLPTSGAFRQITLRVNSSLDAVGLTATVAAELANSGISANMVTGLHHNHVFVPEKEAQRALLLLRGISNRAQYS